MIRSLDSETTTAAVKGFGEHWDASGKAWCLAGWNGKESLNWRKPHLVNYIYTQFIFLVEYIACTGCLDRQDGH